MRIGSAMLVMATLGLGGGAAGCGHAAGGKLMTDSSILPYHAPEISDITGIDEDDDAPASGPAATPADGKH